MRITARNKNGFTITLRRMFCGWLTMTVMLISLKSWATASVANVSAYQRHPWSGQVDVVVKIQGESNDVAMAECWFVATNSATKSAILVEHITRNGDDMVSGNVWTRKFIWEAKEDLGVMKIDDVR